MQASWGGMMREFGEKVGEPTQSGLPRAHLPLQKMREMRVQSPGWEDPLEEDLATHCSVLAWRIPVDRGAWRAAVHGAAKSRTQTE